MSGNWTNNRHLIMTYSIHLDWHFATMNLRRIDALLQIDRSIVCRHAAFLRQQDQPFFDYEKLLFDILEQHKHIWIKKVTGLCVTEFMLRYLAWLCLRNNVLNGRQMCIVTGLRLDLSITLYG